MGVAEVGVGSRPGIRTGSTDAQRAGMEAEVQSPRSRCYISLGTRLRVSPVGDPTADQRNPDSETLVQDHQVCRHPLVDPAEAGQPERAT